MSSVQPPMGGAQPGSQAWGTAGAPAGGGLPPYAPPRENRSVSFFVAIFLGLLLLVSAGLNVVLLLLSLGTLAGGMGGGIDDGQYQVVATGGEKGAKMKVLRIPRVGASAEARSAVIGAGGGSVSDVRRGLRLAASDRDIRGVVLDINSPGGGVTDSDEIHDLVKKFRAEHPDKKVVAMFGDLAASGGYYVAAAADHILARPTTITGSIGVIMSSWNFAEAAKKLGVTEVSIKSARTPYKDMLSMTRPMTDEERAMLTSIVDEMYDRCVTVVDEGRPALDRAQVPALANGGIYSAGQALANGLVDQLGDDVALQEWFESRLEGKVAFQEQRRVPGLRDLFGVMAREPGTAADLAVQLLTEGTGPRFLYWWPGAR